jgi:hypothetical protein
MSTHHDDEPLTIEAICLLARPQLQHDEAMIGLATALGNADPHELRDCLDDNARPLFDLANAPLHTQAAEIADAITNRLGLQATTDGGNAGHLLLNHALAARAAHPMLLATIGHELARHAGLSSVVARSRTDYWTLLTRGDTFLPLGYGSHIRLTTSELHACCPHEITDRTLRSVAADGPPESAQRAGRLRVALTSACTATHPACRKPR